MKKKFMFAGFALLLILMSLMPFAQAEIQCCRWQEGKGIHGCYDMNEPYDDCGNFIVQYDDIYINDKEIKETELPFLTTIQWIYLIAAIIGILLIIIITIAVNSH